MHLVLPLLFFSTPEWPQFREDLTWAIVLEKPPLPAVSVSLAELAARQVPLRQLAGVN